MGKWEDRLCCHDLSVRNASIKSAALDRIVVVARPRFRRLAGENGDVGRMSARASGPAIVGFRAMCPAWIACLSVIPVRSQGLPALLAVATTPPWATQGPQRQPRFDSPQ